MSNELHGSNVTLPRRIISTKETLFGILQTARKPFRAPFLETGRLFAFAKTDRPPDLKGFTNAPKVARIKLAVDAIEPVCSNGRYTLYALKIYTVMST